MGRCGGGTNCSAQEGAVVWSGLLGPQPGTSCSTQRGKQERALWERDLPGVGTKTRKRRKRQLILAVASLPEGPLSVELRRLIYRPALSLFTTITAFLILGIVCLMTLKLDWPGALSIMAGAMIVAVGVGLSYPKASREPQIGRQAE